MEFETIKVYKWRDIEKEICKEMGIEHKYFRDYHKVIGGEYKDLWHEWMRYFQSDIMNGHINQFELGEMIEYKLEWVKEDDKEWLSDFVKVVYKIFDEMGIEYIEYSW